MRPRKKRLWIKPIRPRNPSAPNPVTTPTKIAMSESRNRPIFRREIASPFFFEGIISVSHSDQVWLLFPTRSAALASKISRDRGVKDSGKNGFNRRKASTSCYRAASDYEVKLTVNSPLNLTCLLGRLQANSWAGMLTLRRGIADVSGQNVATSWSRIVFVSDYSFSHGCRVAEACSRFSIAGRQLP